MVIFDCKVVDDGIGFEDCELLEDGYYNFNLEVMEWKIIVGVLYIIINYFLYMMMLIVF